MKGKFGTKQFARSFFLLLMKADDGPDLIVRGHFILKRSQEMAYVAESSVETIINDCNTIVQKYAKAADIGHLSNWATALRELTNKANSK
jgi:hypothetical protein